MIELARAKEVTLTLTLILTRNPNTYPNPNSNLNPNPIPIPYPNPNPNSNPMPNPHPNPKVLQWGFDETSIDGTPTLNQWILVPNGTLAPRVLTIQCAGTVALKPSPST